MGFLPKSLRSFAHVLLPVLFSACNLHTGAASESEGPSTQNFYAHCINTAQNAVVNVVGNTGTPATASSSAVDGDALISENANFCQSAGSPLKVQVVSNSQSTGLSIYTAGTNLVSLSLDDTPYENNPHASSVQTTGIIESGLLYGTVMNCTLYTALQVNGSACENGTAAIVSCANLGWSICAL